MTALASTDVTVSLSNRHIEDARGLLRRTFADLAFGDGALTYPTGGVPLPAKEQFGFKKEIAFGVVEQPPANGFIYKFDRTNHTLKIFTMGIVTGSAGSASPLAASVDHYYIENSLSVAQPMIMLPGATAADTTYDLGPLIELPATIAPAAVTVRVEFMGE